MRQEEEDQRWEWEEAGLDEEGEAEADKYIQMHEQWCEDNGVEFDEVDF